MTGTPKQVQWATEIRERIVGRALDHVEALVPQVLGGLLAESRLPDEYHAEVSQVRTEISKGLILLLGELQAVDSARWWIDRRECRLADLIKEWFAANQPAVKRRYDALVMTLRTIGAIKS